MDKLWLSHTEKTKYMFMYSKLHSKNLLLRDCIIQFILGRAKICQQKAQVIIGKAFHISKEQNTLDQVGFFYLMKYVAYIQNGGSEYEDITNIQEELPLPVMTQKSSEDQQRRIIDSQKNHSNNKKQSSNILSNSNKIDEIKVSLQSNQERQIFQKSKSSQDYMESNENFESQQQGNYTNVLELDNQYQNKLDFFSNGNNIKKLNDFSSNNQIDQRSNQCSIQNSSIKNRILSYSYYKQQNKIEQQRGEENEEEEELKHQNDSNKKDYQINYMQKNSRQIQGDEIKNLKMNQQMIFKDEIYKDNKNVGLRQNNPFNEINTNYRGVQNENQSQGFMTFGMAEIQELTKFLDQEKQKEEENKNQSQDGSDSSPLNDDYKEHPLTHHFKNDLNNIFNQRQSVESEDELKDQSYIPKNNKYPTLPIQTETSYYVPANIDKNMQNMGVDYNENDKEDIQLINSVMECQQFTKNAQLQIKNALDIFKSNREENQFNKSRIKRDKVFKTVRITTYRNEQDNIIKKYVLFTLETEFEGRKFIVERRYNHFKNLHEYFENSVDYYGIIKPSLPSKNITSIGSILGSNLMDQETIEQRKIDLENYINLYLQNDILKNDKVLNEFLEEKEFIPQKDTQFTLIGWFTKMVENVKSTGFYEIKEYTEAMFGMTLNDFFKKDDNDIDTKHIDLKMEQIKKMGNQVQKVINFMNDDIKYDTEQQNSVESLEKNFYTEIDQRESTIEKQKDPLQDSLKKFKSDALDLCNRIKSAQKKKMKVLQEFRIIHSQIESAKAAQQVLKNKIQERIILKKIKLSKFNQVHEQNNNKSDKSEAKRELEKINERFQESEDIIKQIQDKLYKELSTFIEIQKQKISIALQMFSEMNQSSLQKTCQANN